MGEFGLKLMTLNDETLFKYGLRIVGLLLKTQKPDTGFFDLYRDIEILIL